MRASPLLPEVCHRTRQHVSLRLDSELSELEEALVASHLKRCAACQAFASDIEGVTHALRSAPLAEPSLHFELPRRPARVNMTIAGSAAAAAITVAVALGGFVGLDSSSTRISKFQVAEARERISIKEQLLESLETPVQPVPQTRPGLEAAELTTLDASQDGR